MISTKEEEEEEQEKSDRKILADIVNKDQIRNIYINAVAGGMIDIWFEVVDEIAVMDGIKYRVPQSSVMYWRVILRIERGILKFHANDPSTWLDFELKRLEHRTELGFDDVI